MDGSSDAFIPAGFISVDLRPDLLLRIRRPMFGGIGQPMARGGPPNQSDTRERTPFVPHRAHESSRNRLIEPTWWRSAPAPASNLLAVAPGLRRRSRAVRPEQALVS